MLVSGGNTVVSSAVGSGNTHGVMGVLWTDITSITPKDANGWMMLGRKTARRQRGQSNRWQQTQCSIFDLFFLLLTYTLAKKNAFLGKKITCLWEDFKFLKEFALIVL